MIPAARFRAERAAEGRALVLHAPHRNLCGSRGDRREARMFFQRVKTPGLAHVAYVLGSGGEALVVDPRRDVEAYLELARAEQLRIRYVLETHRQEDFVIGAAELAEATGAQIVTGDHRLFAHGHLRLREGDTLRLGELTLKALHTPGHTPESMSYAVFLSESGEQAWGVFSGDALFIGESGRTDLEDPARTAENAGILYDSIHRKLGPLGDATLLFPAHGAGSVCGGKIADRDLSTLGLERRTNPAFRLGREEFIEAKLKERLPRPPSFSVCEQLNLVGGVSSTRAPREIPFLSPAEFRKASAKAVVIDTRLPEAFAGGHLPGAYNVWLSGLPIFGGWVASPSASIFLVLERAEDLALARQALSRLGLDGMAGVLAGGFEAWRDAGLPIEETGTVGPRQLIDQGGWTVLDVREVGEFESGHIPGARHVYAGELEQRLPELGLPVGEKIAVTCSVGHRAGLAVSMLARRGYRDVSNVLGGMTAWKAAGLPTREGPENAGPPELQAS